MVQALLKLGRRIPLTRLAYILVIASLFFTPSTFLKAEETGTTVTGTQAPGASEASSASQIIAEVLGSEPTDPNLTVSLTVQRYDIYLFSEDGVPYASLWMEARISAPGASDLAVHYVFKYKDTNDTEIGTLIPSVVQLAEMLNQDPALGVVFREWSNREERGSIIVLQPTSPGNLGDAQLVFGYYGPLDNPSAIVNIEKVYVLLVAYSDMQAGLWNAAVQEAPLRVIRAEPPDRIKDAIEEGKGLPLTPSSVGTGTTYTSPISEETQETRITVPSQTLTVTTTISMTNGSRYTVNEYEEKSNEESDEGVEEAGEGEKGRGEAGYQEEASAKEEEEGEGTNLPTREIAIAIVIAAVGGVALSFIRKK